VTLQDDEKILLKTTAAEILKRAADYKRLTSTP
jgi:hypothetical protein